MRKSQRWSWLEISLLIVLSAAFLHVSSDLANQWRRSKDGISMVETHLHAKGVADYSADPLGAFIPALDPAILIDLLGEIPLIEDFPFSLPGGVPDQPGSSGNENSDPPATLLPSPTPTDQEQKPTGVLTATLTSTLPITSIPTITPTPTRTPGILASLTPTREVTNTQIPTSTPKPDGNPTPTPTRTKVPSATPTRTVAPSITPIPTTTSPPTVVPTTVAPPPTTVVPTTVVPIPTTVTPPNRTSTPFATRDPTNAPTPTAIYTPGSTPVPTPTSEVSLLQLNSLSCKSVPSSSIREDGCLSQADFTSGTSSRSLWQALIDLLRQGFARGADNTANR